MPFFKALLSTHQGLASNNFGSLFEKTYAKKGTFMKWFWKA